MIPPFTQSTKQALWASAWVLTLGAAVLLDRQWRPARAETADPARRSLAAAPAPPATVSVAQTRPSGDPSGKLTADTTGFTRTSAPVDPAVLGDRTTAVFGIQDPVERMQAYLELLGQLNTNEERTAVLDALLNGSESRERGREFGMFMTEWVKSDPAAALEYTKKLDGWQARFGATTALTSWAEKNPSAAIEWARANGNNDPANEEGNMYMIGALAGYAKTNLDAAAALAADLPRSNARGRIMDQLVDGFMKRGDGAAETWVSSLPQGTFREAVTTRLADRLINKDPALGVAFLDSQPEGKWKIEAYTEAVDEWAERDPNAAGQWLGQRPLGPETDEPRRAFAWEIREQDPEAAMAWAGTISDNRRRNRMMVELARDWFRREPQAAEDFITRQGWPEDVRRRIAN
jgi:hypothetical protein